jgi:hypothetical protein
MMKKKLQQQWKKGRTKKEQRKEEGIGRKKRGDFF